MYHNNDIDILSLQISFFSFQFNPYDLKNFRVFENSCMSVHVGRWYDCNRFTKQLVTIK